MGERSGKLPRCRAVSVFELLGIDYPERRGDAEQPLHRISRTLLLADDRERRDEPERADGRRPLLSREPVVGLVGSVPEDEPVLCELVGDREDGARMQPIVVMREEAEDRRQEDGCVGRKSVA